MSKKPNDLSALSEKIAHKSTKPSVYTRFENADEILGVIDENTPRERITRKSYALTKQDIENIHLIKEKCLNKRLAVSDSHIIRFAVNLAANLSEEEIIMAVKEIPKVQTGRPKLK
jgi:hypothetical protein